MTGNYEEDWAIYFAQSAIIRCGLVDIGLVQIARSNQSLFCSLLQANE